MLEEARSRRLALAEAGASTGEVDREILDLRRKLRAGNQLRAGDCLSQERYLLLEPAGKGGFAVVWRALDRVTGTQVAVKVLHGMLVEDPIRRERFFRGARTMASLRHDAILRVIEPEAEEDCFHYFVMELAEGGDLRKAVLERRFRGEQALRIVLSIGEALAFAHAQGFLHRDVKPQNILLDADGAPKLSDFDLVGGAHTTGGTRTGALGTVIYAAPELMQRPQDADARADVYGLGMTAIFCLHGADLPLDVMRDADPILRGLSCTDGLRAVLQKAVQWQPEDRYASAKEFCDALGSALSEAGPDPARDESASLQEDAPNVRTPPAASTPTTGWKKRLSAVLGALASLLVVIVIRSFTGNLFRLTPDKPTILQSLPISSALRRPLPTALPVTPLLSADSDELIALIAQALAESEKRKREYNQRRCNTSSASVMSTLPKGDLAAESIAKSIEVRANELANCVEYRGVPWVSPFLGVPPHRYLLDGHVRVDKFGKVMGVDYEYWLFQGNIEQLRRRLVVDPESFRLESTARFNPVFSSLLPISISESNCISSVFSDDSFPRAADSYAVSFLIAFSCQGSGNFENQ